MHETESDPRTITKEAVVHLLASALGYEKSDEVVLAAARDLAIEGTAWSGAEVRALVDRLALAEGLVGVVARFVVSRGDVDRLVTRGGTSSLPPPEPSPSSVPRRISVNAPRPSSAPSSRIHVDLVGLLAPALGAEKARDVVEAAAAKAGVGLRALTRDEAFVLLDDLAETEDIVGVVARFAKARLLLEPTRTP